MGNIIENIHIWWHLPFLEFDHDNPEISVILPEDEDETFFEPKDKSESGFN